MGLKLGRGFGQEHGSGTAVYIFATQGIFSKLELEQQGSDLAEPEHDVRASAPHPRVFCLVSSCLNASPRDFGSRRCYVSHPMRLLVTRPEPDAIKLVAVLEEAGHEAAVEPLLTLSFADSEAVDLDGAQALIATSRNALRALKGLRVLAEARHLPLFAVGKATAAEARTLGFETVVTGAGTAAELVAHIVSVLDPASGVLVHLAGDTLARDLAGDLETHGFRVRQPVVYRMVPAASFSDQAIEDLASHAIDGVILMSPRTAAIYTGLVARHGLAAAVCTLPHFCLSEAVASRLQPLGPVPIRTAAAPRLEELLALIDESAAQSDS
jgi:uroporphyrinogen-III synthase